MNNSDQIAEGILKAFTLAGYAFFVVFFFSHHPVISIAIALIAGAGYTFFKLPRLLRALLAGAVAYLCFYTGDRSGDNYNIFLVIIGWVFVLISISSLKPNAEEGLKNLSGEAPDALPQPGAAVALSSDRVQTQESPRSEGKSQLRPESVRLAQKREADKLMSAHWSELEKAKQKRIKLWQYDTNDNYKKYYKQFGKNLNYFEWEDEQTRINGKVWSHNIDVAWKKTCEDHHRRWGTTPDTAHL